MEITYWVVAVLLILLLIPVFAISIAAKLMFELMLNESRYVKVSKFIFLTLPYTLIGGLVASFWLDWKYTDNYALLMAVASLPFLLNFALASISWIIVEKVCPTLRSTFSFRLNRL